MAHLGRKWEAGRDFDSFAFKISGPHMPELCHETQRFLVSVLSDPSQLTGMFNEVKLEFNND